MARKPHFQRHADHQPHGGGEDDDAFPPGPNYLAQFRKPLSEAELDEAAKDFEQAIIEWLAEMEQERDQPLLPGLLPEP